MALLLTACAADVGRLGADVFVPRSDYGLAPRTDAYSQPGDCAGGSRLAALEVNPPEYPDRAFKAGQQGWVVVRLDVTAAGLTDNVEVVDAQPSGPFDRVSVRTVRDWRFQPPGGQGLTRCVVVLDYRLGVGRIGA